MKILKAALLFLPVILLTMSLTPAKKKYLFDSPEGKFSIVFPAEYNTEVDSSEIAVTSKTNCVRNDQTYYASFTIHKVKMEKSDQKDMAEVSLDSFVKTVKGDLVIKKEWNVKGNTGLIALIEIPANDVRMEYRVFVVGYIQYQFVVVAKNADFDENAAAKFFKSFKLKS